jgi:hypothetical protein
MLKIFNSGLVNLDFFLPRGYPGHNSEGHLLKVAGITCQEPWNAPKIYLTWGHLSNGSGRTKSPFVFFITTHLPRQRAWEVWYR